MGRTGKGWAKGLNAATDARVARGAAAHEGLQYVRHLPAALDRRFRGGSGRTLPLQWSDAMAYVVGLMATDGCLVSDGRHLSFDTADEQLAITLLRCLGRPIRYERRRTRLGRTVFKVQMGDAELYRWLVSVGLTPRKSLSLGAIDVPEDQASHLVRGLLDGDGTIQNFFHAPTRSRYPNYRYERLWVFFTSASSAHITWLRDLLKDLLDVAGYVERRPARPPRHEFYRLKYGKRDSIKLLRSIYPRPGVPKLERKWEIWRGYADRHGLQEPRVGYQCRRRDSNPHGVSPTRP